MSEPETVSVILPTYNEAGNIVKLVRLLLELPGAAVQVVVVDDNSPDGTAELVRGSFGEDPRVRLVVRTRDRGLGKSVGRGVEEATGASVVVMDADFNHDPERIPLLLDRLRHADLVVGSRFVAGGGMEDKLRHHCSRLYNAGIRTVLRTRIQDNLSGFFAIRRPLLDRLDAQRIFYGYGDYFFRLLQQAVSRDARVVEVPVFYRRRAAGASKTHFLRVFAQYTLALAHCFASRGTNRVPRRPAPPVRP